MYWPLLSGEFQESSFWRDIKLTLAPDKLPLGSLVHSGTSERRSGNIILDAVTTFHGEIKVYHLETGDVSHVKSCGTRGTTLLQQEKNFSLHTQSRIQHFY